MEFETAGKGGNPFLMDDLGDYCGTTDSVGGGSGGGGGLSSNPFLSNTDFIIPAASDNPFLSSIDGSEPSTFLTSGNSTNPFAQFDYSEGGDGDDGGGGVDTTASLNFFGTSEPDATNTNIFAADVTNPPSADFFGSIAHSQPETQSRVPGGIDLLDGIGVTAPVESDFCKEDDLFNSTPTQAVEDSSTTSTPKGGPPRRPPPPRPVPPSKETKDLILSVTGAMEATSSHLLDRLQATRTPSPTPIRDLHSPSPTPDIPFSDLLGSDMTMEGQLPAFPSDTELNLLGDEPIAAAPSVPKPPPRPTPPSQKPAESRQDIMDIFSGNAPVPSTVTAPPQTNADILGLFGTTVPAEPTSEMSGTDNLLLGDDFGGTVPAELKEVNLLTATEMDLEPAVSPAPQQQQQQQQSDSFMSTDMLEATEAPVLKCADEFDAFAAKFENAAKEDGQEVRVVEGDPFDPFASSGLIADTGGDGKSAISLSLSLNV